MPNFMFVKLECSIYLCILILATSVADSSIRRDNTVDKETLLNFCGTPSSSYPMTRLLDFVVKHGRYCFDKEYYFILLAE